MRFIILITIFLLYIYCSISQDIIEAVSDSCKLKAKGTEDIDTVRPPHTELRTIPNEAFSVGEYLRFEVNYGFITAGDAVIQIPDTVSYNGRTCYRIEFSVDSKPFFNWIYKVEDRYVTFLDTAGIFPWWYWQKIHEGRYRREITAELDQINNIAITSEGVYKIPPYVHDIMSAFFYTRTIDFSDYQPGQKLRVQNFYKDTTYELDIKFIGRETIKVSAGTFQCIILEPLVREGGLFKSDGKVYLWMTDDERKIPVKVSTKILIGSIKSELVEYRGIKGPIRAKIKD